MYHLLMLLVTALTPLAHAAALPAQPFSPITSLNFNTNNVNPGDLKNLAASQNLTTATGGSDNRLLPCLSLQCAQCAAIVFFCAGSCVFAELDLPVCIVRWLPFFPLHRSQTVPSLPRFLQEVQSWR